MKRSPQLDFDFQVRAVFLQQNLKSLKIASVKAEAAQKTEIVPVYSEIFEQLPTQSQADFRGFNLVCGVDEAGRGCWAGDVFAAAVILPAHWREIAELNGLTDSKKLSAKKREQLDVAIRQFALAYAVASATVEEIDQINILQASLLAMRRCLDELALHTKDESHKLKALKSASVKAALPKRKAQKTEIVLTYSEIFEQLPTQNQADCRAFKPSHIIVDGVHCPDSPPAWLDVPMSALIEGDSKVAAISAASVLAKVARDRSCNELHRQYPDYGFNQHKGYGTALHAARLKQFGATPAHRKSFKPVRLVMEASVEK